MVQLRALIAALSLLAGSTVSAQTTIKLERSGGVYLIPCKVNGLELKFIFDTGASDVSLSLTEAVFMLKNGYLKEEDFTGTEKYRVASGEVHEGYSVNLRRIEVGGRVLTNVKASIVQSSEAPLLLGQSALSKLGTFQFDYANSTLVINGGALVSGNKPPPVANMQAKKFLNPNLTYGSVTDIDGNTYATIRIGAQVWMAENLRTSRFQNGDVIPNVTDGGAGGVLKVRHGGIMATT